jgi:hypothetical protein
MKRATAPDPEGTATMTAFDQMIAALEAEFAATDAAFVADSQAWAKGRAQALRDFRASAEAQAMRRDQGRYYDRLFNIAGGKSWFNLIDGRSAAGVEEVVAKNCAAVIRARNARIAAKLQSVGAVEVTGSTFAHSKDGFDGTFVVLTDAGKKWITINTIFAGGYNIQCRHQRTLIKAGSSK